ncbi:MAG: hypothetical protein ACRESW_06860 [Nevskiales bacterium]
MSTTSLKLPDELKDRAAAAAKTRGISTHAFMVEAVRQATTSSEQRARFLADAQAARRAMRKSGKGYAADEVHAYLRAKVRARRAPRPKAKSWRA